MASFVPPNDGLPNGGEMSLGEVSEDCKPVVIGIDFGTAYSGIAYATRGDPRSVWLGAPSSTDSSQVKVPTALLRMEDGTWKFGHKAEALYRDMLQGHDKESGAPIRMQLFKRFKMVLKDATKGYDTLTAPSLTGISCLLMQLITESLRILKDYALERVGIGFGGEFLATRDVQWVLTVPAIWNEFGKSFMRKAAFAAGLMDEEESDNLLLVLEPEGASLAGLASAAQHGLLGVSSRFMVLDCGGGTVDITVHDVTKVQPLEMKAISVPTGGDWGGDYVNLEFKKFLKELLGPDLYRENEAPLEFFSIFAEFEKNKQAYEPTANPAKILLTEVLESRRDLIGLAEKYNAKHPDTPILVNLTLRNGFLTMSKELMMSFYEPFLLATVNETRRIMTSTPNVRHIMVVGGFGSSKVLTDRIRAEFHNKLGVRVILPERPRPQDAIVHGAVYFGLHKNIVQSRVAAFTYGIGTRNNEKDNIFSILIRKGEELSLNRTEQFIGYPVEYEALPSNWNIYRSNKEEPETTVGETYLGQVSVDYPWDDVRANRRQTGIFKFGGSEIRIVMENAKGEQFKKGIRLV